MLWAKHYCQQFHPAYADDIDAQVAAEGAGRLDRPLPHANAAISRFPPRWGNPDRPTMDPWIVTDEAYTGDATRVVMERNPYFWQVDTAGNQLPYIDEIRLGVEQDAETLVLQVIAGEIDMQARHLDAAKNTPVFYENAERGGYDIFKRLTSQRRTRWASSST